MELRGRTAIVTGGAVRLGRQLALALAERGVRVGLHYGTSEDAARVTADEINQLGSEALLINADLRDLRELRAIVARTAEHFGQVDILVNNAGVFEPGDVADTTAENWDKHFDINLKAPFFLSQVFAAHLGKDRQAHIVNIADWRGTHPDGHHIAYTLAKAALVSMTRSLALALAPQIQVNAIAPGAILPPPGKDESYLDQLAQHIPLRRHGSPLAVARAMLYLLESDFVTGEVIHVTGGQELA
jgi:pteridine reductase